MVGGQATAREEDQEQEQLQEQEQETEVAVVAEIQMDKHVPQEEAVNSQDRAATAPVARVQQPTPSPQPVRGVTVVPKPPLAIGSSLRSMLQQSDGAVPPVTHHQRSRSGNSYFGGPVLATATPSTLQLSQQKRGPLTEAEMVRRRQSAVAVIRSHGRDTRRSTSASTSTNTRRSPSRRSHGSRSSNSTGGGATTGRSIGVQSAFGAASPSPQPALLLLDAGGPVAVRTPVSAAPAEAHAELGQSLAPRQQRPQSAPTQRRVVVRMRTDLPTVGRSKDNSGSTGGHGWKTMDTQAPPAAAMQGQSPGGGIVDDGTGDASTLVASSLQARPASAGPHRRSSSRRRRARRARSRSVATLVPPPPSTVMPESLPQTRYRSMWTTTGGVGQRWRRRATSRRRPQTAMPRMRSRSQPVLPQARDGAANGAGGVRMHQMPRSARPASAHSSRTAASATATAGRAVRGKRRISWAEVAASLEAAVLPRTGAAVEARTALHVAEAERAAALMQLPTATEAARVLHWQRRRVLEAAVQVQLQEQRAEQAEAAATRRGEAVPAGVVGLRQPVRQREYAYGHWEGDQRAYNLYAMWQPEPGDSSEEEPEARSVLAVASERGSPQAVAAGGGGGAYTEGPSSDGMRTAPPPLEEYLGGDDAAVVHAHVPQPSHNPPVTARSTRVAATDTPRSLLGLRNTSRDTPTMHRKLSWRRPVPRQGGGGGGGDSVTPQALVEVPQQKRKEKRKPRFRRKSGSSGSARRVPAAQDANAFEGLAITGRATRLFH